MKFKMLSLLFSVVILMNSCKKDINSDLTPITNMTVESSSKTTTDMLLSYYTFMLQKPNANIRVASWEPRVIQNATSRRFYADAGFWEMVNKVQDVKIGDVSLVQDVNNPNNLSNTNSMQVKTVYGTNASFTFKDAGNIIRSKSLYIPTAISIAFSEESLTGTPLKVGSKITWNRDNLNTRGVIFIIRYNPSTSPETRDAFPTRIDKTFVSDDSGSYTFKASDLEGLPLNAYVDFNVGRAGYELYKPENSSKTYGLYGYSMISERGIIK